MTMSAVKGTYVFICDIAGYISGAPIYYRNKALFLEEEGWNVAILANRKGRVYIDGLEDFAAGFFPFLRDDPASLPKEVTAEHVDQLARTIKCVPDMPVIVETGTDWTSYWGELLAERLRGRHIVLFLDEDNQRVSKRIVYFDFKYRRGEMACITKQTMIRMFEGYRNLSPSEAIDFKAFCTNSIQDFENCFSKNLDRAEFNIGSIGRLDKPYIPSLISDMRTFANRNPDLQIQVVFFGGASLDVEEKIKRELATCKNINTVVSGYMWPFPKSALESMDVFASAAGSKRLSYSLGIPTVAMDVLGRGAIGFMGDEVVDDDSLYRDVSNKNPSETFLYFEEVLRGNVKSADLSLDLDSQWVEFCNEYQSQLNKALNCESELDYFDVLSLPVSFKSRIRVFLYLILGESTGRRLVEAICSFCLRFK